MMLTLILLAATTSGFVVQTAGATTPHNVLNNQRQKFDQFHALSKSTVQAPPSSAEKIGSNPAKIPSHSSITKTSTSLNASAQEVTIETITTTNNNGNKTEKEFTTGETKNSPRGEHESNILSRLFYTYASQLLDISSKRQIEVSDALPVPKYVEMDVQVPALERIYNKCKSKAQKQLETLKSSSSMISSPSSHDISIGRKNNRLKQRINERIAKSESLILAKSIIVHQKKNLFTTGILRLANTLIQAFPAILVSRLLKLIESGDMHHPSKAVIASLQLIALLSLKMVIENLYFHNVVKCATMVRGSLTGLIFDKSLRLSSNSANGSSKDISDKIDDVKVLGTKKMKLKNKDLISKGTGGALNLMQTDVSIIESAAMQIHTIWGKWNLFTSDKTIAN